MSQRFVVAVVTSCGLYLQVEVFHPPELQVCCFLGCDPETSVLPIPESAAKTLSQQGLISLMTQRFSEGLCDTPASQVWG